MGRKLLNGCLVILAAFLGPLALILVIGGASLVAGAEEPSDVEVRLFGPHGAVVDEPFTVRVVVTNEADTVQTLDDIDINTAVLEVMDVIETTPLYAGTSRYGALQTYWFEKEFGPGETLEISFEIVPRQAGIHPLQFGVCINTSMSCLRFETQMTVE